MPKGFGKKENRTTKILIEEEELRFTNIKFDDSHGKVALNEHYLKSQTPNGLKTELYPHQKTLVQAILDLEDKRYIYIKNKQYSAISE